MEIMTLLKEIVEAAQDHPLFLGWPDEISAEAVNKEGGDAAFVTLDIAWKAMEAINMLAAKIYLLKEGK